MKTTCFYIEIVFHALDTLWGTLLGLSALHFNSLEVPKRLPKASLGVFCGSSTTLFPTRRIWFPLAGFSWPHSPATLRVPALLMPRVGRGFSLHPNDPKI